MRNRRALLIGGAASVVVLSAATLTHTPAVLAAVTGGTGSAGTAGDNGKAPAADPKSKSLVVGDLNVSALAPGRTVHTTVAVTNPNNSDVTITSLMVSVGAMQVDAGEQGSGTLPACSSSIIRAAYDTSPQAASAVRLPYALGANKKRTPSDTALVPVYVSMADRGNQDRCKKAKFTLGTSVTATGN